MEPRPANTKGDGDRCSAMRTSANMSRRRETRATQRSNVIERARCAGAVSDGSVEAEGAREDGLK